MGPLLASFQICFLLLSLVVNIRERFPQLVPESILMEILTDPVAGGGLVVFAPPPDDEL